MSSTIEAPRLTVISTARSAMGSGTLTNTTYRDEAGNEWYSVGGSAPVLTKTAEYIAEIAAAVAAGRAAREAAEAESTEGVVTERIFQSGDHCYWELDAQRKATGNVIHRDCDDHGDGTITNVATGAVVKYRPKHHA